MSSPTCGARADLALREEIAQRRSLSGRLGAITDRENEHWGLEGVVGSSPTIQRIFAEVRRLQESDRTSVLIAGESGTGKELIARALHYGSARRLAAFVPVNCAAMPADLVESLLFGHVRGTFTGAQGDRVGCFEMAHGGTLFLDEIGEMPPASQAKLLRVLEDGRVQPVGAEHDREVDVRVVAATNVELTERISQGRFRQDLYYRLARFVVTAPPLRERAEDIPLLAQHFLQLFGREMGREVPPLDAAVLQALAAYAFPGNVRELKNVIERALIESGGGPIRTDHLHFALAASTLPAVEHGGAAPSWAQLPLDLDRASAQAQVWVVRRAMDQVGGNVSEAARLLGASRNRIYRVLAGARD